MFVSFTINFLFVTSADWSGHYSGINVHLREFSGKTRVRIGLNLKGVRIFFE